MAQAGPRAMQTSSASSQQRARPSPTADSTPPRPGDIVAAAGLSPAAVYVHHESKEQPLSDLLGGHQRTEELVREAVGSSEDPTEQLRAVMTAFGLPGGPTRGCPCHQLRTRCSERSARRTITHLRRTIHRHVQEVVERGWPEATSTRPARRWRRWPSCRWGSISPAGTGRMQPGPAGRIARFHADAALRIVGPDENRVLATRSPKVCAIRPARTVSTWAGPIASRPDCRDLSPTRTSPFAANS